MQKKLLFFFMVIGCSTLQADEPNGNTFEQKESHFNCLDEGLRNKFSQESRDRAEREYLEEEEKKLDDEINTYYAGSIEKEFEKKGSIQELCLTKKAEHEARLNATKKEICSCDRGNSRWRGSVDTTTHVVKADKKLEKETAFLNERYEKKSKRLLERYDGIEKEVHKADGEYIKKQHMFQSILDSIIQCGTDMNCHNNNAIFEKHLTEAFRKDIFDRVFSSAVKSCKDQDIANEEELQSIWDSNALLKASIDGIKKINALISKELNPGSSDDDDSD